MLVVKSFIVMKKYNEIKKLRTAIVLFIIFSTTAKIFGVGARSNSPKDISWLDLVFLAPVIFSISYWISDFFFTEETFKDKNISLKELFRYTIRMFIVLFLGYLFYECIILLSCNFFNEMTYYNLHSYLTPESFKSRVISFLWISSLFTAFAFVSNNSRRKQNHSKHL